MSFFTEIETSILKFMWKHKRLQIAKAIMSKKSNAGDITTPIFKLYFPTTVTKTVWYWHKNRPQINGIEDPAINSRSYSYLIFDKGTKNIHWRKDSLFKKWSWKNLISTCRRLKTNSYLS
jgi:hypothetical protein